MILPVRHSTSWGAFWTAHVPALAWTAVCTWLLLMPGSSIGERAETTESFEELGHAVLIFALAWLWARSLRALAPGWRSAGLWALAAALVYALALEVAQLWVPGRGFEWLDVATSAVGALTAAEMPGVIESEGGRESASALTVRRGSG